jgi:hypothetical protein
VNTGFGRIVSSRPSCSLIPGSRVARAISPPFREAGELPFGLLGSLEVLPVARREPGLLPRGVVGTLVAQPAGGQVLLARFHLREERLGRAEFGVVLPDEPAEPSRRSPDDADQRRLAHVREAVLERGGVGLGHCPACHGRPYPAEDKEVGAFEEAVYLY